MKLWIIMNISNWVSPLLKCSINSSLVKVEMMKGNIKSAKESEHFLTNYRYFWRNSISNFPKFLRKFQNRTFLKFVPSKHFLITYLVNVHSTWKWFLGRLNIVEHDAINFNLILEHLLGENLSWTWEKFIFTNYHNTSLRIHKGWF